MRVYEWHQSLLVDRHKLAGFLENTVNVEDFEKAQRASKEHKKGMKPNQATN